MLTSVRKDKEKYTAALEGLVPSSKYRGGVGLSRWHISCVDSDDAGPPADLIVRAINETRAEMAAAGDTRPLVVLMGEGHDFSAHIGLQKAVMTRLLDAGTAFAVHMELGRSLPSVIMRKNMRLRAPAALRYYLPQYDPQGRAALNAFAGYAVPYYAPAASLDRAAFCLKNGIKTVFNDASKTSDGFLDFNDRATRRAALDTGVDTDRKVSTTETDGVTVRNVVMATHPAAEKLVLQFTGRNHVFGKIMGKYQEENSDLPFAQSLTAACEQAGFCVLPVFLTTRYYCYGVNMLPSEAYDRLSRCVLIDDFSQARFYSEEAADEYDEPYEEGAEARYLTQQFYDSTAPRTASFVDVDTKRSFYQSAAEQDAEALVAEVAAHENGPV